MLLPPPGDYYHSDVMLAVGKVAVWPASLPWVTLVDTYVGTPVAAGVGDTGVDLVGGMALDLVDDLDLEGTGVDLEADLVVDLEDSGENLVGMAAGSVHTAVGTLLGTPEAGP